MLNGKIRELYQPRQKTAQKSLETKKSEDSKVWYNDPFVRRVIVVLLSLMAISVIAGIVFLFFEYSAISQIR